MEVNQVLYLHFSDVLCGREEGPQRSPTLPSSPHAAPTCCPPACCPPTRVGIPVLTKPLRKPKASDHRDLGEQEKCILQKSVLYLASLSGKWGEKMGFAARIIWAYILHAAQHQSARLSKHSPKALQPLLHPLLGSSPPAHFDPNLYAEAQECPPRSQADLRGQKEANSKAQNHPEQQKGRERSGADACYPLFAQK